MSIERPIVKQNNHTSAGCVDLLVDRHVRGGHGERIALIEHGAHGRRTLSYRQLQRLTQQVAQELDIRLAGRRSQQRIALAGSATLETVVHWLAGMRAGHLVFMVHPQLPRDHYEGLWDSYDPSLVLADATARLPMADAMTPIEQFDAEGCPAAPTPSVSRIEACFDLRPALVLATSGSTGRPKLCVHAHRSFWEFEASVSRSLWQLRPDDRVMASSGPFFSFGLQGLHAPLAVGATAVLLPQPRQHTDFLETIEAERVSVFLAVPTLYHLLMARATRRYDLSSLRVSMSAGERLPPVVRSRWQAWSGSRMLDSIGTTETFAPYLSETADGPAALQAVPGFRYVETLHEPDEPVSGAFTLSLSEGCMMLGYLRPGEGGAIEPLRRAFATHDLFVRDAQGLRFVSRASERIKVAGHWVSPQELEEFLLRDLRVLKAAALPIVTPEGLTRLRAYVVCTTAGQAKEALVEDLLKRAARDLFPKALRPDRIEVVADIATTPSGKLKRQELRSLAIEPAAAGGALFTR